MSTQTANKNNGKRPRRNARAKNYSPVPFIMGRSGKTVEPIESDDKGKNIVKWGQQNLYPQWLNSLFYSSPVHSGIIRSKVFYTVSGGLAYEGPDQDKWELMFKNGTSDVNLDQLAEQISMDVELYNGFALRGRWSLDRSRCARLDLIPFETARQQVEGDMLAVSPDWSDNKTGWILYEPLDPQDRDNLQFYVIWQAPQKQLILNEQPKIQTGVYPLAPYTGGIKAIQTDMEIINFQHSEIINNFALGTIVNMNNGRPKSDEDRKMFEKRIKNATGTDGAGATAVFFNNGKDNAVTVEKLSGNDLHQRYLALSADNRKNILTAHSVTSTTLFGLEMGGNFNASEMEIGWQIMNANYFTQRRRTIEQVLNEIAVECNGINGEIFFNEIELNIPGSTGFSIQKKKKVRQAQEAEVDHTDAIIAKFAERGRKREGLKVLHSASIDLDDFEGSNLKLMEDFKKLTFQIENPTLLQVLKLVNDGEDFGQIAEALSLNPSDLSAHYLELVQGGYLDEDTNVTEKGILEIAVSEIEKLQILYSYEKRPGVEGADAIPTTRDFCRELIRLDRVYTRQEIDEIGDVAFNEGLVPFNDVWRHRGGWYRRPGTDSSVPFCRHEWRQNLVFE